VLATYHGRSEHPARVEKDRQREKGRVMGKGERVVG